MTPLLAARIEALVTSPHVDVTPGACLRMPAAAIRS
jgi:hypothetical protein